MIRQRPERIRRLVGILLLACLAAAVALPFLGRSGGTVRTPPAPAATPIAEFPGTTAGTGPARTPPAPPPPVPVVPVGDRRDDVGPVAATEAATSPGPDRAAVTSRRAAERTASAFLAAFARPSRGSPAAWWRRVAPFLTEQAREDYLGVDPATVPFTRVTGPAAPLAPEDEGPHVLMLRIPTDGGDHVVHLVPDEAARSGWAVSRLTPPRQP